MDKSNLIATDMKLPSIDGGMVTVTDDMIKKMAQSAFSQTMPNGFQDKNKDFVLPKNQMVEEQKITNERIACLQESLDSAKAEIKQLNDKNASQNLYIKQLTADLKEEALKRELAESKVSAKDWKVALIAGVIGLVTGLICAYFGFYLSKL